MNNTIPKIEDVWHSGERITSTRFNKINGTIDAVIDTVNPMQIQVENNTQAIAALAVTGGASIAASVIFEDGQNAEYKVSNIENDVVGSDHTVDELIYDNVMRDFRVVPTLGGQPMILYGAGTPAEAVVPINWKQFDPETEEGFNWIETPSMLGQRYVNTAGNTAYIAVKDGTFGLKWILI